MPAKKEISLLPDEENPNSLSSRILKWLTTVGRFIIVFTELIVISAFLSRFWLDRKDNDLSETLRQQKAILESTKNFEKDYTLLQQRLKIIKDFYSQRPDYLATIKSLSSSTPPDVFFSFLQLDLDPKSNITAEVTATALNSETINRFLSSLSSNPEISLIDVKNIDKKVKENKYSISLHLVFKSLVGKPKT